MKKLLPYALGASVLLVGGIVGSRMFPSRGPITTSARPASSIGDLKPVRVQHAPEVLYLLVTEGLVEKLKPGDLLLTRREYWELIRETSLHLRQDLGLVLPPGFVVPADVSESRLEQSELGDPDQSAFIQQVQAVNREYLRRIVARLLDDYAPQTMQLITQRLAAIRSFRKQGDAESLSFVKALYGENFVNDYATAHHPREDQPKPWERNRQQPESSQPITRPAREVAAAQAQVSSLWRTEFTPEELSAVGEYVLNQELQGKLRDDFLYNSLSAAERSLMEKSALGSRLIFLHDLTCKVVSAPQ